MAGDGRLVALPDAGPKAARLDQHDPHSGRRHLHPQRVADGLEGVLRRLVPTGERRGGAPEDRRHVDDAAASRGAHGRQRQAGEAHRRDRHRLELVPNVVVVDVLDRAGVGVAGVVDEAVQVEPDHHLLAPVGVGDVEDDRLDVHASLLGCAGQRVGLRLRPHRADRSVATASDIDRCRQPDARIGPGRQDRAPSHGRTLTPAAS